MAFDRRAVLGFPCAARAAGCAAAADDPPVTDKPTAQQEAFGVADDDEDQPPPVGDGQPAPEWALVKLGIKPPPPPEPDRADPSPGGFCNDAEATIYDPARGRRIVVPIYVCQ